MAKQIAATVFLSLGGTDVSTYVRGVTLNLGVAAPDSTTMGDGYTEFTPGLKNWSMDVEFVQDFASGALDSILWALHGTTTAVNYRPNSAVVGTSNPQYSGAAVLSYNTPATGTVGDLMTTTVTLTGSGALTRATA